MFASIRKQVKSHLHIGWGQSFVELEGCIRSVTYKIMRHCTPADRARLPELPPWLAGSLEHFVFPCRQLMGEVDTDENPVKLPEDVPAEPARGPDVVRNRMFQGFDFFKWLEPEAIETRCEQMKKFKKYMSMDRQKLARIVAAQMWKKKTSTRRWRLHCGLSRSCAEVVHQMAGLSLQWRLCLSLQIRRLKSLIFWPPTLLWRQR